MAEIDRSRRTQLITAASGIVIGTTVGVILANETIHYQNEITTADHIEAILQKYHFSQWRDISRPFIPSWGKTLEKPTTPEEDKLLSFRDLPAVESNSREQRTLGGGLCNIMTPAIEGTVFFPSNPKNWDIYVRSVDRPIQVHIEQRGEDAMFAMEDAYALAQHGKINQQQVPNRFDGGDSEVGPLPKNEYLRAYVFLVQKPSFLTGNEDSIPEPISRRAALTTIFEALK